MSSAPAKPRLVIVGAGLAGAATAWAASSARAFDIVILEKEELPGMHATGRNAAMVRRLVGPRSVARLAARGAAWIDGSPIELRRTGSLLLGDEADLTAYEDHEGYESLSGAALDARLDGLGVRSADAGLFTAADGVVDVAAMLGHFLTTSRRRGAELRTSTEVTGFATREGAITGVETTGGTIEADVVVNAAGAWASALAERAGASAITCTPLRRHLFWTGPLPWVRADAPWVWHVGREWYLRPESGGLLLCACDTGEMEPCDAPVDDEVLELLREKLMHAGPELADVPVARSWAGLRTFAPDDSFVIGWDGALDGFFWVAGLGGHGVTCAAAVGELAARLLGAGPHESSEFDPRRFLT